MAEERTNRLVTRDEKRSYYEIGENYHEMERVLQLFLRARELKNTAESMLI